MLARCVTALSMLLVLKVPAMAGTVDVDALLRETEEAVEKLDASIEKASMRASLAMAYAKRGNRQKALHLLNRAVNLALNIPPDWISLHDLLDQSYLMRRAIRGQAKLADVAGALRNAKAWSDSQRPNITGTEEYESVVSGQADAGDVAGAWATCDRISPLWGFRALALSGVAVTLAEARHFEAALETVDRLDKVPAENKDAAKTKQLYRNQSLLMIACEQAKCGRVEEALRTAERPNRDLLKITTLQHIAKIRLEHGDERVARQVVAKALSLYARLDAAQQRSLWTMAPSQAEVGDVPGALKTTSELLEGGGKGFALLAISIAQSKVGERAKAAQTFKEGLDLAKSRPVGGWYTLLSAAEEQVQGREFDRAMEIAQFVERPSLVLRDVAVGLAQSGNIRRALEIAYSIKDVASDKAEALSNVAAIQAKAKDALAKRTFQHAFEAAMSDEDDVVILKKVGLAQVRAGYVDAAADTFRETRKRVIRAQSEEVKLADIARAQAGGGDPAGALAWARSQSSRLFRAQGLVGALEGLTEGPE
ncbi:MAG TPA: hypothetical protein VFG04_06010 [Planctomycetaceae bacterium]|nr:hypothetical protein [Planctomycetaceae bacterium]